MRVLLVSLMAVALASGCHTSSSSGTPSSSAPVSPDSSCSQLGGAVGVGDFCEIRNETTTYKFAVRFPIGYPDPQAVADYVKRTRTDFMDWIGAYSGPPRSYPFELDMTGAAFRSGDGEQGTRSLVFTVGNNTGVHPVATYKAFNYSLVEHAPITFETLFKPGSNPLSVLNPIVGTVILKRDPTATEAANDLTADSYQQFAITDDTIVFYFNQDGLLPHEDGPLQVAVPRSEVAPMLS